VLELDRDLLLSPSRADAAEPLTPEPAPAGLTAALEKAERAQIVAALERADGVIEGHRGAAKILDIHPNTLRSRMEKLGIKRSNPRGS